MSLPDATLLAAKSPYGAHEQTGRRSHRERRKRLRTNRRLDRPSQIIGDFARLIDGLSPLLLRRREGRVSAVDALLDNAPELVRGRRRLMGDRAAYVAADTLISFKKLHIAHLRHRPPPSLGNRLNQREPLLFLGNGAWRGACKLTTAHV